MEVEKVKGSVTMTPACFAGGAVEIFGQSMGRDIDQCFFICTSKGQTYGLSAQNPMVLKTWVAALNDLIGNFDISDVAATTSGQLDGGSTSVEKAGWLTKQVQRQLIRRARNDGFSSETTYLFGLSESSRQTTLIRPRTASTWLGVQWIL